MNGARDVFMTGATGYIGCALAARLVDRGHRVRALVRRGSEARVPSGCTAVVGNALDAGTFASEVRSNDTFVQLVGVPHPSPAKAKEFRTIDLASARAGIEAAKAASAMHFVYVSVAHPAPAMKAYVEARTEAEALLEASALPATILRPWYVLGPGHRWPVALLPLYWILEKIPATRATALRLGFVTLEQMVTALAWAVEHPANETRILEVPDIRRQTL
jgi:uncharacterized protein YbjT (DUF2867 family)